jgi:hypothetical protein
MHAVSRAETAGLHAEFLYRIREGIGQIDIGESIIVISAIQEIVVAGRRPSSD